MLSNGLHPDEIQMTGRALTLPFRATPLWWASFLYILIVEDESGDGKGDDKD